MNLPESIKRKLVSAEEAVSIIKSGENVFVGTACATPRVLIAAMEDFGINLSDLQIFHFLTDGAIPMKNDEPMTRFKHRTFFVGNDMRKAIKNGQSDYIPISIAQVPSLIENGRIAVDTALVQVSPPEGDQYVSLGISIDITKCAVRNAKKVIAELNPNMPHNLWRHIHSHRSDRSLCVGRYPAYRIRTPCCGKRHCRADCPLCCWHHR